MSFNHYCIIKLYAFNLVTIMYIRINELLFNRLHLGLHNFPCP